MQLKYFISLDKSKKADTQSSRKDLWSRDWSNYLLHECGLIWSAVMDEPITICGLG